MRIETWPTPAQVAAIAAATVSVAGAAATWVAGRLEARGEIEAARRTARSGGITMAAGCLSTAILIAALHAPRDTSWWLGLAAWLGAAVAGLLTGLSRKPRPSGHVALVLLALALVVTASMALRGRRSPAGSWRAACDAATIRRSEDARWSG